jgi:hypothetical protein
LGKPLANQVDADPAPVPRFQPTGCPKLTKFIPTLRKIKGGDFSTSQEEIFALKPEQIA